MQVGQGGAYLCSAGEACTAPKPKFLDLAVRAEGVAFRSCPNESHTYIQCVNIWIIDL